MFEESEHVELKKSTSELKEAIISIADIFITVFKRKERIKTVPEKYPEKYPENINNTQKIIIDLINSNKNISLDEIARKISLSLEGVKKNIKKLKSKGIIKRIGPDKGGHWEIINNT